MDIFRANELNLVEVHDFIQTHLMTYQPHYKRLKDYYDGNHDILSKTQTDPTKPNVRLVNSFPSYIVDQAAAYFMGTPVDYSSSDDSTLALVEDIYKYNDEADTNATHSENIGIYGVSYEIHYIDKEDEYMDTRFTVVNPNEIFIVYDYNINPSALYAVRYYEVPKQEDRNTYKVEIYSTNMVQYYTLKGTEWILEQEVEHLYKDVPVVEFVNNKDRIGDFEKVMTLINEYNNLESTTGNDFEYFSDAYLFIKGATIDENAAVDMKTNKIINVAESDAEASFLVKSIQDAALENYKNRLVNDIHKFSGVPNLTDEAFAGNLSGVAIKYKLIGLENITGKKERSFKKALQRRLELIYNLLFVRGRTNQSNYFDVNIAFKRTLPANELEQSELVRNLYGTLSSETLIGLLDFIDNPVDEAAKLKEEKAAPDAFEAAFTSSSVDVMNNAASI